MKQLINFIIFSSFLFIVFSCNKKENSNLDIEETPPIDIIIEGKIPEVYINTNGATIIDEPKINAEMTILLNDEIDYEGNIAIEIRGSSSQNFPKKQ